MIDTAITTVPASTSPRLAMSSCRWSRSIVPHPSISSSSSSWMAWSPAGRSLPLLNASKAT
jgi:hypothetical protein